MPKQKRVHLTHGSARVEHGISKETLKALDEITKKAYETDLPKTTDMSEQKNLNSELLAPYLPYSLKVLMDGQECNVAWMSTKNIAVIISGGMGEWETISWKYANRHIKPILKSLDDLEKPMFYDGREINPAEEFFGEIFGCGGHMEDGYYVLPPDINTIPGSPTYYFNMEVMKTRDNLPTIFINQCEGDISNITSSFELDYRECLMLIKWKFDLFGLIDSGLALNEYAYEKDA